MRADITSTTTDHNVPPSPKIDRIDALVVSADSERASSLLYILESSTRVRVRVFAASCLEEASSLDVDSFAAAITDLAAPGVGVDTIECIRQAYPSAAVIALVTEEQVESLRAYLDRSVDDYLVGTRIEPAALERAVAFAIEKRRADRLAGELAERKAGALAPLFQPGGEKGAALSASWSQVTGQVLEDRVAARAREMSALLNISQSVASTLQLKPLVSVILDQLRTLMEYRSAALFAVEAGKLTALGYQGPISNDDLEHLPKPLEQAGIYTRALAASQPTFIDDLQGNTPQARAFQEKAGEHLNSHFGYVRSWMGVPLLYQDRMVGLLSLAHDIPGFYTAHHARLGLAIGNQAAVAIENAKLYEEAQESVRRMGALAHIASSIAYEGSLETILDELAHNVVHATGADACAVVLIDQDTGEGWYAGVHGLPEGYPEADMATSSDDEESIADRVIRDRLPIVKRNVRESVLSEPTFAPLHPFMRSVSWDTIISVPLFYRGRTLGTLSTFLREDANDGEHEISFLTAIADQAAVAVANAQLISQAQDKAALEERQRLARELHDSVSQAIFSIALHARSAKAVLKRNPEKVGEPVEHISALAQAAMAEMRALIFELRPESLENEGLVAAIEKQSAALEARHSIDVRTGLCPEPPLSLPAKEVAYRVMQEAAHNTMKHAGAEHINIRCEHEADWVVLQVEDDGAGFDTNGHFPGHLGLRSMRERAVRVGGQLTISSTPGKGTLVTLRLPLISEQNQ